MKKAKKILIATMVLGCLMAVTYALLFTTVEIPEFLIKPTASVEAPSRKRHVALVLKWVRRESLKRDDLIVVTRRDGDKVVSEIQRLEKVQPPDDSERQKVPLRGRHRASGRIAQAILDMDFRPQYWIATGDATNSTGAVRIEETDIKGKVVYTFTKTEMR